MKCVQLVENRFQGPSVTGLENKYQLHFSYGVDLLSSFPLEFCVASCEGEMETQVPDVKGAYYPPSSDMKWRSLPKLTPTHSPAWGHLKMELDLQAMLEEDSAPKCRRNLYLAFKQSEAENASNMSESSPENSLVPCDADSLYEEPNDLVSSSMPKPEDRNLARLIAKFDSSIEALWNPEDVSEMVEDVRDDESDEPQAASPVPMDVHGSKQNLFIACGTNITSSIWSSRPSPEEPLREEWSVPLNVKWSEGDVNPCIDSLVALNHNREDSSFTEVIPRMFNTHRVIQPPAPAPPPPPVAETNKDEEDLLTSARTHFIPIRQEQATRQQQHQSTSYADGTTFAIPTNFERIIYTRSESGTLYIEDEADMDSPPKYMEYKVKEVQKGKNPSGGDFKELVDFVPKFRLSQNEKCCQTEQEDTATNKTSPSALKHQLTAEDFFFPGDEHLSLEAEEEEICQVMEGQHFEKAPCQGWMPGWPTNWRERHISPQSWYHIWSDGSGCLDCSRPAESHKSQLRRELSEDGEQLLSDLSSLLDQYGGVLSEISGNKYDHPEKMAEYTINYKIVKTGPLSNMGPAEKERKRRFSSSQRVCSLFLEGSCRRPHCRFSHDMASIPCHFWADASCLKGGKCPFLHGGRPVTL